MKMYEIKFEFCIPFSVGTVLSMSDICTIMLHPVNLCSDDS